jgi:hypothetical protein
MGLPNIKRNADALYIDSVIGRGRSFVRSFISMGNSSEVEKGGNVVISGVKILDSVCKGL